MTYLLDTQILVWALTAPDRLPADALDVLEDPQVMVWFSAVNIWEVATKSGLGRPDFTLDPHVLRREALGAGFVELAVDGAQAALTISLPRIHHDPFDRILVAQATAAGLTLLTHDQLVGQYPGPVRLV